MTTKHRMVLTCIVFISIGIVIYFLLFTFSATDQDTNYNLEIQAIPYISHSQTNWSNITNSRHWNNVNNNNMNINLVSSWQQLNEQQFCSIEESLSDQLKLMKHIYNVQFNKNCSNPSTTFLIYDIALEHGSGLGASLSGNLKRYLTISLILNRTLLLHGKFDWSQDVSYCNGINAMECYFMPLSNCDPIDILSKVNKTDRNRYWVGTAPKHCIFGDNDKYRNLSHCPYKVIYVNQRSGRPLKIRALNNYIKNTFNMNPFTYKAMVTSFFLRPQLNIKHIIYDKINKSINKSLDGDLSKLNISRTMSLPIRASDKCENIKQITNKQYTHQPEINCFTPLEYVLLMNAVKYLTNNSINTVILTSEDSTFLDKVSDIMRYHIRSNVSNWNIIRNTEDFSAGEGTITYKNTIRRFNISLHHELGTSLETDHIVSALSSLILQTHLETAYIAFVDSSSWTVMMWQWLGVLNCNINKTKHILRGNRCIELSTPGYMQRDLKHKIVEFSKEIWNVIRKQKLEPQIFLNKFGIRISNQGYQHWCEQKYISIK